ncbi:MAG TPA: 30S ribosomal protein S6 [Thermomicrobiales bacterium]|nr:30S ribosomal protein S6 [Thermomicrobiales bacterium]
MREYAPEARTYELMTILSPDVTEENIPPALEVIGGYIISAGGELQETLTDSPWGRRRLAYPIRHGGRDLRDGYYTLYHFVLQPSSVGEIERELKLNTDVIRYLVTRYEPVPVKELTPEEAEIAAEDEAAAAYAAAQASGGPEAPADDKGEPPDTGPATLVAGETAVDESPPDSAQATSGGTVLASEAPDAGLEALTEAEISPSGPEAELAPSTPTEDEMPESDAPGAEAEGEGSSDPTKEG